MGRPSLSPPARRHAVLAVGGAVGVGGWPVAMTMLAGVFSLAALSLVGNRVLGAGL